MKNPDLTDSIVVHVLAQLVFERTMRHLQSIEIEHLRNLTDKTLKFIIALGIHVLFLDLHKRRIFPSSGQRWVSLESDVSQRLYCPVRDEVVRKFQLSSQF